MTDSKYFTNQKIADLLREIAAAYTIKKENVFKIKAYEEAAASIEHLATEVKDAWDHGRLDQVPGIGEAISGYLDELFRQGKVKHFKNVKQTLPPAMFVFLNLPGIGAKTAHDLAIKLGIISRFRAVERLKEAAKMGKISKLENFGNASEKNILRSIEMMEKRAGKNQRMLLPVALSLANEIIKFLKISSAVIRADPLGSLRRMVATIGDIDIAVSTRNPEKVLNHFFKYWEIDKILGKGERALGRVILKNGQQVDLRLSSPEEYGSMLQYFTGSKQHNILLREYALKKGLSLSEYGIKNVKSPKSKIEKFNNEIDFYHRLKLPYIPPEIREGNDEISSAQDNHFPQLVEFKDIKGDLHLHSDFPIEPSHDLGKDSFAFMLSYAEKAGYQYLGFSEHNPSASRHSNKNIMEFILKRNKSLEQYYYSREQSMKRRGYLLPINIFKSLEVDIKPNGDLAVSDQVLNLLDYAIVSIHSSFNLSKIDMTKRIIYALSHKKAKILGHPTGRMLNEREEYEVDWDKVFDFCTKNGKILEISAHPARLDLPDLLVRQAIKYGVRFCINSDAHRAQDMNLMPYGVSVARRGWAEKKSIINTLPLKDISDILLS